MTVPYFLDTNVLIYAAMGKERDEAKRRRARDLIASADFGTSTQVIQEFYVNIKRLTGPAFRAERVVRWIERLRKLDVVETDVDLVLSAIVNSERYTISYWDGAILAAAQRLEAPTLYTEDLTHGQRFGSVRVLNPFRDL